MPAASGSAELRRIAVKLRETGDRELRLKMTRGLRVAAEPLRLAVRNAAVQKLPHAGALNDQVAGQRVSISVLTGARTAGVRMRTTAPDTKMTDSGYVRHPLPGNNRSVWVTQQISQAAGWWSVTLRKAAPLATPALAAVMAEVTAEIEAV